MKKLLAPLLLLLVALCAEYAQGAAPQLLAQANPTATATLTVLYTVPAGRDVNITTVWVANRDTASHSFRISVAPQATADALSQYIYYNISVPGSSSLVQSVNLPMIAGDQLRCYVDSANFSFSVYGVLGP